MLNACKYQISVVYLYYNNNNKNNDIMTREDAIEILKENAEVVWGKFNNRGYSNKKAFAEHAINHVIAAERFMKNGKMPLFALIDVCIGYTEMDMIQGGERDEARAKKYKGTAFMSMV